MTTVDASLVRAILKATDEVFEPQVKMCKFTFRAAMFELLRLMESQNDIDVRKSMCIQRLTHEYTCTVIAGNLFDMAADLNQQSTARDALLHAYYEVNRMKNLYMLPMEGRA